MDAKSLSPVTCAFAKAGLAAGTTTTLTSANAMNYAIKGKAYVKAAATNEATPTLDAVTGVAFLGVAAGKGSIFSICRNAGGDLKVIQGSIEDINTSGEFIKGAPQFGPLPENLCMYGYVIVKVAAGGATWTFGASNLAGPPANTTITYVDTAGMPERPQNS